MQITSSDFQHKDPFPAKCAKKADNVNPALTFSEIPEAAQSLALILEDPDAPGGVFTHWIVYNMSPGTIQILEGSLPVSGVEGCSDYGEDSYGGPQPPSGTHRYYFKLFALDNQLQFEDGKKVDRQALYEAMDGHIVETAELMGTFSAG